MSKVTPVTRDAYSHQYYIFFCQGQLSTSRQFTIYEWDKNSDLCFFLISTLPYFLIIEINWAIRPVISRIASSSREGASNAREVKSLDYSD